MITWELHYMEEVPEDLKQEYPDYEKKPFIMKEETLQNGSEHYTIYSNNPFIRVNPIKFAIQRYKASNS